MFAITRSRHLSTAVVVTALTVLASEAFAGTSLTLPASGSGAAEGAGLSITNTEDSPGGGHKRPFAIDGIATGAAAGGVLGRTTKHDGIAVYGLNSGTGLGGYFLLNGAAAIEGNSALKAVNSGGSNSINGPHGNAGFFEIENTRNTDTAVFVETFGNGTAFHAETHGAETASAVEGYDYSSIGGTGVFGYSLTGNAAEFVHGSGGNNSCTYDGASSGWNCTTTAAMMDNLAPVDVDTLLARLAEMPIAYFTTRGARHPVRELGPSAEDFRAAFALGRGDGSIAEGNAAGVALAAAKGLYRKLASDEAVLAAQRGRIAILEEKLAAQQLATASLAKAVAYLSRRGGLLPAGLSCAGQASDPALQVRRP